MSHRCTPLFIPSEYGELFALHYTPLVNDQMPLNSWGKAILFIPAFAEEMNKARHLITLQAKIFCERGYSILILDLLGTGDSQGDFSEATWDLWLRNINVAVKWLKNKENESISLWGLRTGVLLAIDFLHQYTFNIDKLICWQPVLNGETYVMQFLRLRIAAAVFDKNAPQEKTSDLKRLLQNGQNVEVAGYELNSKLIKPMLVLRARQLNTQYAKECNVFELITGTEQEANIATRQWIQHIEEQGVNVTLEAISGSFFWATQEIVEVPELIKATTARIGL